MEHQFNTSIAKEIGLEPAILLHNIVFWVTKNKANDKHFHEGYHWTYNSHKAFLQLFDYMSEGVIKRALMKLEDTGYILKGCFNKSKYDRTAWYTITEKTSETYNLRNSQKQTMGEPNMEYGLAENSSSFSTDSKPVCNPIVNKSKPKEKSSFGLCFSNCTQADEKIEVYLNSLSSEDAELMRVAITEFIEYRKQIKKPFRSPTGIAGMINQIKKLSHSTIKDKIAYMEHVKENEWEKIKEWDKQSSKPSYQSNKYDNSIAEQRAKEGYYDSFEIGD